MTIVRGFEWLSAKRSSAGPASGKCTGSARKDGLRKILAVSQCYVDDVGEAALYPGWFVDLTKDAACEEQALHEIHNHVGQARDIARSIGHDMLSYLLDNIEEEVKQRLGAGLGKRRSS